MLTKAVLAMLDSARQLLGVRQQGQDGQLQVVFAMERLGPTSSALVSRTGAYPRLFRVLVDKTMFRRGSLSTTRSGPVFLPRSPPNS